MLDGKLIKRIAKEYLQMARDIGRNPTKQDSKAEYVRKARKLWQDGLWYERRAKEYGNG